MEIKSVTTRDTTMHDSGVIQVGKNGVYKLLYHEPAGEGDAHYVDILFENGEKIRVFRPDEIEF